jgi:hypothetical protein
MSLGRHNDSNRDRSTDGWKVGYGWVMDSPTTRNDYVHIAEHPAKPCSIYSTGTKAALLILGQRRNPTFRGRESTKGRHFWHVLRSCFTTETARCPAPASKTNVSRTELEGAAAKVHVASESRFQSFRGQSGLMTLEAPQRQRPSIPL